MNNVVTQADRLGTVIAPQHAYSGGLFGRNQEIMLMETLLLDCDPDFPELWFPYTSADKLGSRMEMQFTLMAKRWRSKKK